jgi:hypothetical protein
MPSRDVNYHSYADWVKNYKGKGISYQEYMQMDI